MSIKQIKEFIDSLIKSGSNNYSILSNARRDRGNNLNEYSHPVAYINWRRDVCDKKTSNV